MATISEEFKAYANCSGVMDILRVVVYGGDLPKIEFDDLKKLEGICSEEPLVAHKIVKALISYNGNSFYHEVRKILQEHKG